MNLRYAQRSEDTEQINVMNWARCNESIYPELKWLHHCPNGGTRNRGEAIKFKQLGVKAGVSDIFLPCPKGTYHGLYIEMKYGSNKTTAQQKEFLSDMAAADYYVATCYGAQAAVSIIKEYLELCSDFDLMTATITVLNRTGNKNKLNQYLMSARNNSVFYDAD